MSWHWLSPFGNAALVLPLVLMAAMALAFGGEGPAHRRAAATWVLALGGAAFLVAASKIAFYGWGTGVRAWNLTCFSGHAVLALSAWPPLLMLMFPARWRRARAGAVAAGLALGLAVGVSRVQTDAHPWSEVVAGVLLGLPVGLLAVHRLRRCQLRRRGAALLTAPLLALLLWSGSGSAYLPSERWFAQVGIALSGQERPYQRRTWLQGTHPEPPQAATSASRGGRTGLQRVAEIGW